MTDSNYPEIDGLKIIQGGKGSQEEWAKALHFLFDERPDLLMSRCKKVLLKYHWLWKNMDEFNMQCESFKAFLFICWLNLFKTSKFDPQKAHFIQYLLGSIESCHFAIKFIEQEADIANNFTLKKIRSIIASGKNNGKSEKEIEKEVQQYGRMKVLSLSDMNRSDSSDEEDNNNGSDFLETKPDLQNQRFQIIKTIIRMFIEYLNDECKELDEDHFLSQVNRQAGAQLYPEMTNSSLLDSPEAWIYSDQKQSVCNQKGIRWILQKTLREIERFNPEQKPEQTLYDLHQKAAQNAECKRDKESEAADDAITRNPAFNRLFAPITDFDDLQRLFGITTEKNARAERSRYTRSVAKWLNQNGKRLKTKFAPDN